jgi:alkylation response protein AidB-like acyl-CoA dehydrogenase
MELTELAWTDEQRDLRDAVRGLLAHQQRRAPGDGDDGRPLWQRLCGEIGVAGLAIPQRYGGAGAGPVETHIVMEELGRGLTCSPLLGSGVLAAQALLASGDAAACERLLPAIADGSAVAALAWAGEAGRWDPGEAAYDARPRHGDARLTRPARPGDGDARPGWELDGEAHYVLDSDRADVLLAAARAPDGIALFEVDPRRDHHGHQPPAGGRAAGRGGRPPRRIRSRRRGPGPGPGSRVHRAQR